MPKDPIVKGEYAPYVESEAYADLGLYLQIIFHEFKTLLLFGVVAFALSSVFLFLTPNTYETEVQILVEQVGDTMEKLSNQAVTPSFRGEDDYYGTQVVLMTAKKISDRVNQELNIKGGYLLTARRLRGTRVISVTVKSRNPKLAADVANKTIDIYTQEKAQDDLFIAKQMLQWLPNQMNGSSAPSEAGANEKLAKKNAPEMFLSTEADDPIYQQLRQNRMETEAKISELSFRYKPSYPVMKELNEKLAYLDQQIAERKSALVGNLKASLMGDFHLTNIKVLSPAPVPQKPISPKRAQGIFLMTVLGLLAGVVVVLYIEKVDPRIWYENNIHDAIDVPFMGYIPLIPVLATRKDKKNKPKGGAASFPDELRLQNLLKDSPTLADAVAFMRTHLFFSVPYQKSKALLMTSTSPNEGKSTVIALFALSLASMGKKILIIDGDLRRPYLHIHLGIKNKTGLSEFLLGQAQFADIVQDVPDTTLKIITGGSLKGNSAQLLTSSPKLKELLDVVCEQYDFVLVDAPPVLYIPDGLIMAKYTQGVILITSAGVVRQQGLQSVKHKFDGIGRPVVGVAINRANHSMDIKFQRYFKQYKNYYYSELPETKTEVGR